MQKRPVSLSKQLSQVAAPARSIVRAARKTVRAIAPMAEEIAYRSSAPRSRSAMWKLARYAVDGEPRVAIGAFTTHASLFFFHGADLDDGSGLLQGTGKDLRYITLCTPADAERPAVRRVVRRALQLGGTARGRV